MAIDKKAKENVMSKYKAHSKDTGSPQVQVALLTERINQLTGHFKAHSKDFQSRRGLLKLVSTRRRLLDYLKKRDEKEYETLIEKLNLRK